MPPPPSQQGKFKPRKPKKVPKPGASSPTPITTPSSTPTVNFAPSTFEGRGGRGRGGRGRGRGRGGRAPVPSGKTFFTGADKPKQAAVRKKTVVVDRIKSKDTDPNEEIIGTLDTAIGSSGKEKDAGKTSFLDSMDYFEGGFYDDEPQGGAGRSNLALDDLMYDSDSSQEELKGRLKQATIAPVQLPFPTEKLPVGVGVTKRPVNYEVPDARADTAVGYASIEKKNSGNTEFSESLASPFVDQHLKNNLLWEQKSWFLVQFPTRLPPLKHREDVPPAESDGETKVEAEAQNNASSISEVVTPPIVKGSFDNKLVHTAPGRIGKMVVYKSGKTVLVMEGPNGSSKVSLSNHLKKKTMDCFLRVVFVF